MLPMMSTRPCSDCGEVDERVDVGALGDVDPAHDRGAAVGLDLVGGGLRAGLVDVAADDRGARRCESIRAVALPMPLPTPVSTATRSGRSNRSCARLTGTSRQHHGQPVRAGAYRSPRMDSVGWPLCSHSGRASAT